MKKMMFIMSLVILTGAVMMGSCKRAESGFGDREKAAIADTISKMMDEVIRYASQANVDSTFKYLSDDSAAVYVSGGMHFSYGNLKTAFAALFSQIKSQEFNNLYKHIIVPSRDFAVWISFENSRYTTKDGKTTEQFLCETWLWQRKAEGWKVVHYHEGVLNLPDAGQKAMTETSLGKLAADLKGRDLKPGDMKPVLTEFLKKNPLVYGSTLAFAPVEKDGKKQFAAPYFFRSGNEFREVSIPSTYDYTKSEWYSEPVNRKIGCWSHPYYDEGVGGVVMVTYGLPLFDKENKLTGVLTADIRLQ